MTKASYLAAVLAGLQAHRESASAGGCLADVPPLPSLAKGAAPTLQAAMQPLHGGLVCCPLLADAACSW